MPLAVHRSASSVNMRQTPQRTSPTSSPYPYPYAYLYTYDTLFNNSLGMPSFTTGSPSSSARRRRQRVLGVLGLSDDDDSERRRRMRRGVRSGSSVSNTSSSTSTRLRPRRVASEGSAASRQVLAEIEWWRVVEGQRDLDIDLDVEEDVDDEDTPGLDTGSDIEPASDNAEDEGTPVYSPSIPPLTRARSHAHDDFTLTHSSAHSRTSSSSSSDSELEMQHRVPRHFMPFPTGDLKLNGSTTTMGVSIFPSAASLSLDCESDLLNTAEFNESESAPNSTPSAIVKAALAALFPSSIPTPPASLTCSPTSQPLGFSLSLPLLQHDASDVGIYTPALPHLSRVRAISLPETSNIGCNLGATTRTTKHSRSPAQFNDDMLSETLGNL